MGNQQSVSATSDLYTVAVYMCVYMCMCGNIYIYMYGHECICAHVTTCSYIELYMASLPFLFESLKNSEMLDAVQRSEIRIN